MVHTMAIGTSGYICEACTAKASLRDGQRTEIRFDSCPMGGEVIGRYEVMLIDTKTGNTYVLDLDSLDIYENYPKYSNPHMVKLEASLDFLNPALQRSPDGSWAVAANYLN